MPGKRQLLLDRKDADVPSFSRFSGGGARQNESCLRKIHLPRQSLHLRVRQSASVSEDRQGVARERHLREDIKLNEFVSASRHKQNMSMCA